jgi:hypothetical protein
LKFRRAIINRDSTMPKSLKKPRFKVGDRVDVLTTLISRFSGRTGVIIAVEVNQYARSLDEYTVQFEDGSENLFWEFQLKDMGAAA